MKKILSKILISVLVIGLSLKVMMFNVSSVIFKKFKIFYSIVIQNTVNMMDYFFGSKISSEVFFHYKPVLKNIIIFLGRGMVRSFNKHITLVFNFASSPIISFFHSLGKANIMTVLFSEFYSHPSPTKVFSPFNRKWFTLFSKMSKTYFSFPFFVHYTLQIKKAVFDGLMRIRLNILHLLTGNFKHRKIATSLTIKSITYLYKGVNIK